LIRHLSKVFILFFVLIFVLVGCAPHKAPPVKKGMKLPALVLEDAAGVPFTIPADLKGKVVVMLFWSKGCPFCKREMPSMEPLYQKYKDRGYVFVGVHVGDGRDAVKMHTKTMGLTFPMLLDEKKLTKLYGLVAEPSMFFLDREGVVTEKILGGLSAKNIEVILKEKL
jgi:peroxiredoxin